MINKTIMKEAQHFRDEKDWWKREYLNIEKNSVTVLFGAGATLSTIIVVFSSSIDKYLIASLALFIFVMFFSVYYFWVYRVNSFKAYNTYRTKSDQLEDVIIDEEFNKINQEQAYKKILEVTELPLVIKEISETRIYFNIFFKKIYIIFSVGLLFLILGYFNNTKQSEIFNILYFLLVLYSGYNLFQLLYSTLKSYKFVGKDKTQ